MKKYYQAEMHCHTRETGPCGRVPAARLVEEYIKKDYGYLFITDHMHEAVMDAPRFEGKSWEERVDHFLSGYRAAKKAAEGTKLKVILAMELTKKGHDTIDFLIYGEDEKWIYEHPFMYYKDYDEIYELVKKSGFMSFQAHPYRYHGSPVMPICYDGVEIFNSHPRHVTRNKKAVNFAYENGLYTISGGDVHQEEDIGRGGILLPEGIENGADLVSYIKENGSPEIIITFE